MLIFNNSRPISKNLLLVTQRHFTFQVLTIKKHNEIQHKNKNKLPC
jgi:hypothetical protein